MTNSDQMQRGEFLIEPNDCVLVTGASGFIGSRVVEQLLALGIRNVRCLVRPASSSCHLKKLGRTAWEQSRANVELVTGNLLSRDDCTTCARDVSVIFHLAAARGEKSFPDAFMNSVVTTRNLLEAAISNRQLRRFVNVSSFTVYTNEASGAVLDEASPVENHPEYRGDAYCFAKKKQEELVIDYSKKSSLPYVIVRPGYVFGPGNTANISGRVGIGTFGVFLHLGGSNRLPFTYVDNCARAIALAGLKPGVDGEIFNVVDDDLPTSREFLRQYKARVRRFGSIYVPHAISYSLCALWERYSAWSHNQIPPVFNRSTWRASWKKARYSNRKLRNRLGWTPIVTMDVALSRYFEACTSDYQHD